MIKYSELSKQEQKEVKSILNGNGMTVKQVNIYKDDNQIALEVKSSGTIIKVN